MDDKIAPVTAQVQSPVAALIPKPIRFVVNTHWHPDHRGGNGTLAADGAVIIAHENVRQRLSVDGFVAVFGRKLSAPPAQALPNGGSYVGMISAADTALDMVDRATRIIPGHGPASDDRGLREWRGMMVKILERVRAAVASGASLEMIKRGRRAREWDEKFAKSFVTSDHVVEEAYRSVTSSQAASQQR